MNLKLESVTLHANPAASARTIGGEANALPYCGGSVTVSYKVRAMGSATLNVKAASVFGKAAIAGTAFTRHETVKLNFSGGESEVYRVESTTVYTAGGDVVVQLWPYWSMLDRRRVRINRQPTGYADLSLSLVNVEPLEALTEVLSHNAPPYFAAGTVHSSLASARISIDVNGETHLTALYKILDALSSANGGLPAEFETRWSGSVCYIDVVPWVGAATSEKNSGYTPQPQSRPIDGPTGSGLTANRLMLSRANGGRDYFNRVIPVAGSQEERVTIAGAYWTVASATYDGFTDTTVVVLEDAPLAAPFADPDGTLHFGTEESGFFPVDNITGESTFRVEGNASSLVSGRFAIDTDGTQFVALSTADAAGDDAAEEIVEFPDLVPYENLLRSVEGISENLSDWVPDSTPGSPNVEIPRGLSYAKAGIYATIEKISYNGNESFVRNGPFSAKITLAKGDAVRIGKDLLTLKTTDLEKAFSVGINAAVESGTIRLELIDSAGARHPAGPQKAETSTKSLVSLTVGGIEAAEGAAYLEITAVSENGAAFYLDGVNVTRSGEGYQYTAENGPRDLWLLGLEYLRKRGGDQFYFQSEFIDASLFNAANLPVEVGSWVRARDAWNGSSYDITVDGRVMELEVTYSNTKPLSRRVRFANEIPDVTGRLLSGTASARLLTAPVQERFKDYFESTFTASSSGDTVATIRGDLAPGLYDRFTVDVGNVTIEPGTLLELRTYDGSEPISVFTTGELLPNTLGQEMTVSAIEPEWEEIGGQLMTHEAFLLNKEFVNVPRNIDSGTGFYLSASEFSNTIKQTADSFRVTQKVTESNLLLDQIAVIGEDITGTTSSLDNLQKTTRVALRRGWQLGITSDRGPQSVTVSEDVAAGSDSIPIVEESLDIRVGDIVRMDQAELVAFSRVEPGEVEDRVQKGEEAHSIARLDQNLAAGLHGNLPVLPLGAALQSGESYRVQTKNGNSFPIVVQGNHAVNATSINIVPTTFPEDIINGIVRLPETITVSRILTAEGEIDVRVRVDEVIAAINLSADRINGARVEVTGQTTFAAGYNPSTKAEDADTVHVGEAAQDVNNGLTTVNGDKITTNTIVLEKLAFVPGDVDSETIVATIKASQEGLKIDAELLEISGTIEAGNGIQSSDYVAGTSGWRLGGSGNAAEFRFGTNLHITANSIAFGGSSAIRWYDSLGGTMTGQIYGNAFATNKAVQVSAGVAAITLWDFLDKIDLSASVTSANAMQANTFNAHTSVGAPSFIPDSVPTVTGSRSSNAALASLLSALAGLGLLNDSTSA